MMKIKQYFTASIMIALCLSPSSFAGFDPGSNSSNEAALKYFEEMLKQAPNGQVARLIRQNISALQPNVSNGSVQQDRAVEVPFMSRNDNSMAVPVLIDKKYMASFLVDTGASYTVITPRFAQKAGIQVTAETPRITLMTANGRVEAPFVTIPTLSLGEIEVHNVKAVIQDISGGDFLLSGLLGMDYFKNMAFTVKSDKLIIHISSNEGHSTPLP
jgi:clan AA aspartic protease (TIGR02281 family)